MQRLTVVIQAWRGRDDRFLRYLADFCLPSLLAKGNLPRLEDRARVWLVMPDVDWVWLNWPGSSERELMDRLRRHATVTHLAIPTPRVGERPWDAMRRGHELATDLLWHERGLGCFLAPDLVLSDGALPNVLAYHRAGASCVLVPVQRVTEEGFLDSLPPPDPSGARRLTGRDLVRRSLPRWHSETRRYEWDRLTSFPMAAWWRMRNEGIILHTTQWCPVLVDYAKFRFHHPEILQRSPIGTLYLHHHLGSGSDIVPITDSDDAMIATWSPSGDRPKSSSARSRLFRGAMLRGSHFFGAFDPLAQSLFWRTVRWHTGPLTHDWEMTSTRIVTRVLCRYLSVGSSWWMRVLGATGMAWCWWTKRPSFAAVLKRFRQACAGDPAALDSAKRWVTSRS